MNNIVVYGPGCAKCTALADVTKQAMQELHLDASLEKVTDAMQFAVAGVLVTPALVIDGKVLVSGRVPSRNEIKKILQEAIQVDSSRQKSCCCSGATDPALPQENGSHAKEAPCCGGSYCSSEVSKGSSGWKKAVVWVVVLLILLAIVKIINHRGTENREEPADTAVTMQSGVEAVYYEYGARCPTYIRMETWTREVVEKNFPVQLEEGKLAFHAIPADKEAAGKYELVTKSLILKDWKDGKETRWVNLDRIWDLSDKEQEFKAYVVQSVRKALDEAH